MGFINDVLAGLSSQGDTPQLIPARKFKPDRPCLASQKATERKLPGSRLLWLNVVDATRDF